MHEAYSKAYNRLNTKQKEAVDTIYGSVMVVAGPGTGKTQVLSARACRILELTDARPDNILITTFTEAWVVALKKRLSDFMGPDSYRVKVTTLHAFAKDIIDRFPEAFLQYRAFNAIDELDSYTLLEDVLAEGEFPELRPVYEPGYWIRDISGRIKKLRDEAVTPEILRDHVDMLEESYAETLSEIKPELKKYAQTEEKQARHIAKLRELAKIYEGYEAKKRQKGLYDFTDMILHASRELRNNTLLATELAEQYQFIMVDEFQDLSSAQNNLLEAILSVQDAPNIMTVGDDDQSIYRFQGANLENMFHFSTKFQDTKIIVLEENYRSIEDVLAIARKTIDRNNSRIVKLIPSLEKPLISKIDHPSGRAEFVSYPTFVEEQMAVLDGIRAHHATGIEYEEMAILVRTNREVSAWSELLAKAQIPYESREKGNLLDTEEMALFEHILRVTEMSVVPDRSLIFVLRSGIFDVEKSDIYRLIRQLSDLNFNRKLKFTLFDLLIREDIRDLVFAERAPIWTEVTNKLVNLREKWDGLVATRIHSVLDALGVTQFIREHAGVTGLRNFYSILSFVKNKIALRSITELSELFTIWDRMRSYGVALASDSYLAGGIAGVKIYTAHQSKGLEFEVVYVPSVLDGVWWERRNIDKLKLPQTITHKTDVTSFDEIEEERRLFFVAITRAKHFLSISFPESDNARAKIPSLFVTEATTTPDRKPSASSEDIEKMLVLSTSTAVSPYVPGLSDTELAFIAEKLQSYRLSASDLTKFLADPMLFLEESIFRYPFEDTPRTIFGKVYHKALEDFYLTWKKDNRMPTKQWLLTVFERLMAREVLPPEYLEEEMKRGLDGLTGWYDLIAPEAKLPLELEYSFSARNIHFEGIPLTGKIDRLDEIEEGFLRVSDYKTGRIRSENEMKWLTQEGDAKYFRQLLFYKLLIDSDPKMSAKYEVRDLVIDFVEGKNGVYRAVSMTFSEEDMENLKKEIHTVWKQIMDLEFWKEKFAATR